MMSRFGLFAGLLIALAAAAVWSAGDAYSKWRSAADNERTVADCRDLAGRIQGLQGTKRRASLVAVSLVELTELIERTAGEAQIPPKRIRAVSPLPPVKSAGGTYRVEATDLSIDDVALPQIMDLIGRLGKAAPGISVTGIELSIPTKSPPTGPELWRVQLRLTQLVYAPITPIPSSPARP